MNAVRGGLVAAVLLLTAVPAWAQEPLAVLTEIQVKSGKGIRAALGEDQPPPDAGAGV